MNKPLDTPLTTIHFLRGGFAICGLVDGVPATWAEGHLWSNDKKDVTCKDCLFCIACEEDGRDDLNNQITQNIIRQNKDFRKDIKLKMTLERARLIRDWRVELGYSWRSVAEEAFYSWGTDALWTPPGNSIAGQVLCGEAAAFLGEDFNEDNIEV